METRTKQAATETSATTEKTLAIIAYLTIIGLIAAFVMNKEKNDAFAGYHIKQSLGLCVCGFAIFMVSLIPILGWIASFFGSLFLLYLWIIGLINATNEKVKPVPFLGQKFEEWFQNV